MLKQTAKYLIFLLWINASQATDLNCLTKAYPHSKLDPTLALIHVTPAPLQLKNIQRPHKPVAAFACTLYLFAGTGTPGFLTLTNHSQIVTAYNLQAILPADWTDVSQDASNCAVLMPGQSCQLRFTPGNTLHNPATVSIVGEKASPTTARIAVVQVLQIGDFWQGGFIFQLNPDGVSGKVAAPADHGVFIGWGGMGTAVGVLDRNNGFGNTNAIVAKLTGQMAIPEATYAAGVCELYANAGYSDWFLPAINELTTLWQQSTFNGGPIGGFSASFYWSSTESSGDPASDALNIFFTDGSEGAGAKSNLLNVRCIRNFSGP